jgi:hypothetical protein
MTDGALFGSPAQSSETVTGIGERLYGEVAEVMLWRTERLNTLTADMWARLAQAVDELPTRQGRTSSAVGWHGIAVHVER